MFFFAFALALASTVLAAPPNKPASNNNICKDVVLVVDILNLYKATSFCSSYIHIPTVTSTAVVTASPVTSYTSTATSTFYSTVITTDTT
jgi:hypothetical protein